MQTSLKRFFAPSTSQTDEGDTNRKRHCVDNRALSTSVLLAAAAAMTATSSPTLSSPEIRVIDFYDESLPYPEFSNFFRLSPPHYRFVLQGESYATSEHRYQMSKFRIMSGCMCNQCTCEDVNLQRLRSEYSQRIACAKTPAQCFYLARQRAPLRYAWGQALQKIIDQYREQGVKPCEQWNQHKEEVMKQTLYVKFTQNQKLAVLLLQTGQHILREHSVNDSYWADGGGDPGKGKNRLGVLLMELRTRLEHMQTLCTKRS